MSELAEILEDLRSRGVELWVHDGALRYRSRQSLSAPLLATLSAHGTDIIDLLERDPPAGGPDASGGRRPAQLPLSHGQESLWFLDQLGDHGAAYHTGDAVRIEGDLDVGAFERACREVVARHEVLRTRFRAVDGVVTQEVCADVEVPFGLVDLGDLPTDVARRRARELTRSYADRRFDLAEPCPYLMRLLRVGPREHVFVLWSHHIVFDAASFDVLLGEVAALYETAARGERPTLPPPAQYADYALWQRRWTGTEDAEAQLARWRARLDGAPEGIDLPFDHLRPAVPDHAGGTVHSEIAGPVVDTVRTFAREHETTTFTVVLSALVALLARWSGQPDICVGVPVDARPDTATDQLLGYFLNTTVVRARLAEHTCFADLLGQVRQGLVDSYDDRLLPFDMLVADLRPQRDALRQPLFQVMVSSTVDGGLPPLDDLELSAVPLDGETTAKFDLSVFVADRPDGIRVSVEYARAVFDRSTIERLSGQFQTLLARAIVRPDQPLAELELLTDAERRQLVAAWTESGPQPPADTCLHGLVEAQARRTPDAEAVVTDDEHVTYRDLDQRANRWAHHLRDMGVGPEARVAICTGRSVDTVVAILAVLKAGGAYVPLDPAYPPARLAYMLDDSRATIVLTRAGVADRLGDHGAAVVRLDADAGAVAGRPATAPAGVVHPTNLAYCLYTSGSTGEPKGVAVQHANAAAFVRWAHRAFGRDQLARVLFSTSICFDLSVFELFAPLTLGGAVVVVRDALALCERPVSPPPTLLNTVPSAGQALAALDAVPSGVRAICLAGEPLRRHVVDALRSRAPAARICNGYGPSETTTYSTFEVVGDDGPVTIGRPVSGTRAYVLDGHLAPVPIGMRGEVHLAGAGVTRGYLDRPALTAERYLPDPFGPPGSRMYRTGDIGRHLADGRLDVLGRADHQVKVRGYRIELGEVESALLRCGGVRDTVVVAAGDGRGDNRLAAYVVGEVAATGPPWTDDLRAELAASLPDHMIPRTFVVLDELPRTANGKVDRTALPSPETTGAPRRPESPRTPAEAAIADLFSEVLGVAAVGAHDDFFALGGHSLLAVRLANRVRATTNRAVTLQDVFEGPTPAALATVASGPPSRPALTARPRDSDVPLSPAQRGLWYLHRLEGYRSAYNVPFLVRVAGDLDVDALGAAVRDLLVRHEVLRTVLPERDGRPVQRVLDPADLGPVLAATPIAAADLAASVAAEVDHEFDLRHEPPTRVALFRLGPREHVLTLVLHHIAVDGWSFDLLWRDLGEAYAARRAGGPPRWRPLPVQYADYALWQAELLGRRDAPTDEARRQLDHWRRALAGVPHEIDLPFDRPRPRRAALTEAVVSKPCDPEVHSRLHALARACGASMFMVAHAAVAALLDRVGAGDDLPLGTPMTGRTDEALDDMVGYVVNTLVLRTDTSGGPTFRELVERVRRLDLEAFAHQDLPFDHLVEELNPPRSPTRNPLFQVMLAYVVDQTATPSSALPDLAVSEERVADRHPGAKADLLFDFVEHGAPGAAGGIDCTVSYGVELFDRTTAEALLDGLLELLRSVADDPTQRLVDVELPGLDRLAARRRPRPDTAVRPAAPPDRDDGDARGERPAPRVRIVTEAFAEVLDVDAASLGADDDFFELGGHSLLAVELLSRIRAALGVDLGLQALLEAGSVSGVLAAVERAGPPRRADPFGVVLPLRDGPGRPLFCVHPIIGLGWCYTSLVPRLPATTPVVALQSRGLDGAGPSPATVEEVADDYLAQVRSIQPSGPYQLLGWSFGGNVAHAMATRLQAQGEDVRLLVLVDSYHLAGISHDDGPDAGAEDREVTAQFVRDHLGGEAVAALDEQRLAMVEAVTDRNVRLLERHRPERFRGDVVFVLAGTETDRRADLVPAVWEDHVSGRVEVHTIAARHLDLLSPGPVERLAAVLTDRLHDPTPTPTPVTDAAGTTGR